MTLAQQPGSLPPGFDHNSELTPEEFCVWQRVSAWWFRVNKRRIAGLKRYSRKMVRIHVGQHLAAKGEK